MFGLPEFLFYILIAMLLVNIPVIGKYFRLLNTLIHEIGHVLVSLFMRGKAYKIKIFRDTSGLAYTGNGGWLASVLVSLAGYIFASFVAFSFIYLIYIDKYMWVLYMIVGLLIISLLLWVRNVFGFLWVTVFLIISASVYYFGSEEDIKTYVLVIVAFLLVESTRTPSYILMNCFTKRGEAGDADILRSFTGIPSVIWALFFTVQSLVWLIVGIQYWI